MTLDDRIAQIRKDLLKLANEMIGNEQSECAIALLQAEQAVVHADNVMSENGIDGTTKWEYDL